MPAGVLPAGPADVPGELPLVDEAGQRRLHRDLPVAVAAPDQVGTAPEIAAGKRLPPG